MRINFSLWLERVLALLIGLAIWGYVNSQGVMEMAFVVPIEYRDIGNNIIIESTLPQTATVRVRGSSWLINKIGPKDISVIVSFEDAKEGLNKIRVRNVNVPSGVEVVKVIPEYIEVKVKVISEKEVPVIVLWHRKPRVPYIYSPTTVILKAEESRLKRIKRVYTEPVDGVLLAKQKLIEARLRIPSWAISNTNKIVLEVLR